MCTRSVKGRPGVRAYIITLPVPTDKVRTHPPAPGLATIDATTPCPARRPHTVCISARLARSRSPPAATCSDTHVSTLARRNTNARSLAAKPGALAKITCSNSECSAHPPCPEIAIRSHRDPYSYRIHLSPGSRRSGNSLLNQSRISAQSRKTVAPSSSILPVPRSTPPVVDVPFTIIDGPPVVQIPPATPSDQSLSPPNTPPPLMPADPQIAFQHFQRQHNHNGNSLANTDVNANVPTWQPADLVGFPVRPLSSSSLSSSDAPSELINTPANFPSELGGFSVAAEDHLTQASCAHDSWLMGDNSYGSFSDGFSKEVTTLSPTPTTHFIDFPPRFYEPSSAMTSNFYPTPIPTPAQFYPQQSREPETPAQLYMSNFKSHAPSPHDSFAGYSEPYVNQMHARSNSLPNLPFPGNSPPGMPGTWNHVRNDFASTNWTCANQQRPSWA